MDSSEGLGGDRVFSLWKVWYALHTVFILSSCGIFVYRVSMSKETRKASWEVSPFSNFHVHLYVANCLIFNFLFSFSGKRTKKICFEKGWSRTSDVQKWLQQ